MTFTVVEKEGHPATVAELAVLKFAGESELKGMSDKELAEASMNKLESLRITSVLALAMLRMDKDEMCEKIKADPEPWGDYFGMLDGSLRDARDLLNFLEAAQARLIVAGSTLEQGGWLDGPGGDGEPMPEEETVAA